MRILWLTTDAFGQIGGIARYNRDFLKAVCRHDKCEEVVVIPRLVTNTLKDLPPKLTWLADGESSKLRYSRTVLRRVISDSRIDLVVCGHINLLPIAYCASRRHRVPLALIVYGIDVWQPTKNRISNWLVSKVDSVISISKITLEKCVAWAGVTQSKLHIIPNAIDLREFVPGPKDKELLARYGLEGKTVMMTMGRLVADERYKGVDELLELLPHLKQEIPNVFYLVIGEGSDRSRLEEKSKALGISSDVAFLGYIPEEEKLAHYRLSDVYVMPSHGEGFGFVFLEAMASGIPVTASKIDGGREALRDGLLGVLVDPGDPDDIKRGIHESLQRPRGIVPDGLTYFSYQNFEHRVHRFLDSIF
jgi:phosphatidyl-myo-inositol dimannoside synthase